MSEIRVDQDTATRDEPVASFRSRLHAVNTRLHSRGPHRKKV